ncbi:MAG: hypothetical protein GAK30_03537 [Paracidovorax wautersii]|uniref:Uracil-DNA glycosylase-like domain-containing protein n=1 Tax=Paracidovorax wautersii TaxID=1177982 RepID=A0A7V8JNZ2_9BURK|nr:MAG: hypothetical protein GAK30_03537 [Paracidovorax wautersii]
MLAEMGIRVWQGLEPAAQAASPVERPARPAPPERAGLALGPGPSTPPLHQAAPARPAAAPAPTPVAARAAEPVRAPSPARPPADLPVDTDLATLDWPALQARLAQAALPEGQARVLSGHGDPRATWLFVQDAPGTSAVQAPADSAQAAPAERLLDNMLRACSLSRQAGAFLAYVHHGGGDGQLARLWLERVIATLQPKVVVLMSRPATQSLLQTSEAPGRLRGQPLAVRDVPVVVSYPAALLLGKPDNKARAWADLCRARALAAAAA